MVLLVLLQSDDVLEEDAMEEQEEEEVCDAWLRPGEVVALWLSPLRPSPVDFFRRRRF